jgi:hypothetical protein
MLFLTAGKRLFAVFLINWSFENVSLPSMVKSLRGMMGRRCLQLGDFLLSLAIIVPLR